MKKIIWLFFLQSIVILYAQEDKITYKNTNSFQLDYLYTNIIAKDGVEHLATNATKGILLSWNKKTYGLKQWQQRFNFPDVGVSFGYTNFNNPTLRELYAIYGHYNFYLFNKEHKNNLVLGLGAGFAYTTNPYDKVTNNKNITLGSHFNTSTYLRLYYQRDDVIIDNLNMHTGFTFIHASNGSLKSPNKGINLLGVNVGVSYDLVENPEKFITEKNSEIETKENYHFNINIFGGANEPDLINAGLFPFFSMAIYFDKRFKQKYALQLGTEFHFHYYLKEDIMFTRIFNGDVTSTDFEDWKRFSLFVGYELSLNKSAIFTQLGYYLYSPYKEVGLLYERVGIKRYINESISASISVKAHGFNAEALEFGIGYRF